MTSAGTGTIRAPGLLVGLASLDNPSPTRSPSPSGRTAHRPSARAGVRIVRRFRPAPNTFADAVDEGPSVVVAVPAEGLHGGRAGAGPLRHGAAGRAPGGVPVRVRAPVPAGLAALGRVPLADIADHGPALGVVLPRLAAAVGRHVEQAQGPVDRLVATA